MKTVYYECHCGQSCCLVVAEDDAPVLRCPCGMENTWTRITYGDPAPRPQDSSGPYCFARNREYQFNKRTNYPNMAWPIGRSDEDQHAIYQRIFADRRKRVEAKRRSMSRKRDGDWEYIGGMPLEMEGSICDAEGDKEVVMKDPVTWLKKTGLYMGSD